MKATSEELAIFVSVVEGARFAVDQQLEVGTGEAVDGLVVAIGYRDRRDNERDRGAERGLLRRRERSRQ